MTIKMYIISTPLNDLQNQNYDDCMFNTKKNNMLIYTVDECNPEGNVVGEV